MAPRYLVWVRALFTGIRHFFMILCALCDSEVFFRNYHVFEYSATNINRRVRRDVKICLITST